MPTLSRTSMYQLYVLAALNTYCSTRSAEQLANILAWQWSWQGTIWGGESWKESDPSTETY